MLLVLRTKLIIGADELSFLLLWSNGYIGSEANFQLSCTVSLLFPLM